jgi:small subunit ribosomal protein S24e
MDIKIINEKQAIIPRKEITLEVTFEKSTPKRLDLKKEIAKKTKNKEELLILKKIITNYGKRTAKITAYVYKDEETLKKIEYSKVIEKNTPKAEKKEESEETAKTGDKSEDKSEDKKE